MDSRQAVEVFENVVAIGGPDPEHYQDILAALDTLHREEFEIVDGLASRKSVNERFANLVSRNWKLFKSTASMQGFARLKPHGYAGDFEIIERIYNGSMSADPSIAKWDAMFHLADGVKAVRNRSSILVDICGESPVSSLLSVGGGPALDLRDVALSSTPPGEIVLLDNDANAIARGKANLAHAVEVSGIDFGFECRNALRYNPERRFELVWSSGLFDYLADKVAVFLMKRLKQCIAPGGRLVVGNFSHENASRAYCEVIGEWLLIHRSPEDLKRLAVAAGFEAAKTQVIADSTGVNLFLVAHG